MRLERLPMIVIKKIDPNDWTFEIINASKYPIKVEFARQILQRKINKKSPQYVRFRHIFGSKGIILIPNQRIKITDKFEAKIDVPGILKVRASNLYYSDLVLEYDIRSGKINRAGD